MRVVVCGERGAQEKGHRLGVEGWGTGRGGGHCLEEIGGVKGEVRGKILTRTVVSFALANFMSTRNRGSPETRRFTPHAPSPKDGLEHLQTVRGLPR